MKDRPAVTSELLGVSRDLLSEAGGDHAVPITMIQAAEKIFRQLEQDLRLRIGDEAFRSMLELAQRRAVKVHPSLESLSVDSDMRLLHRNPKDSNSPLGTDLSEGLVRFVAESFASVRRLARDQDWDQVELWPVLRELDRRGLPTQPRPAAGGKEQM
jgi:hypothetical protein